MSAKTATTSDKLIPVGDRVLVQRIDVDDEQRGGIYIPDSAREKPQEARVVALGSGRRDKDGKVVPFEVKAGDRVLLSKYGGTEVTFNDAEYQLVREDDILAILK